MKRLTTFAAALLTAALALTAYHSESATTTYPEPSQEWLDGKYSMFIHFGLYSSLGGVWDGKPVTVGYSEQIQSHAGIYADVYESLARQFDPKSFNADSIAALARRAGMRSIVITSKHHDGFCLWNTKTTDFSIASMSPSHRDIIAELSDACHRAGVNFGLYFSIIDWNLVGGSKITSHNANFITPQHHSFNLAQVRELLTSYGEISELWFDMGSLTPQQSSDLYNLVHELQPQCMVSGRLGNGCYDFAVMSDNYYPTSQLQSPWQSCASMFNETWGYRSWQERGDPHDKALEKLRSLVRVMSGGGNFLLNIGPTGEGTVVPFEADVLEEIGQWLSVHGDAIYATSASPYRETFDWGCITSKGNCLNLILSGQWQDEIMIPLCGSKFTDLKGNATATVDGDNLLIRPAALTGDKNLLAEVPVITVTLDKAIPDSREGSSQKCSYFCQDYYTNARSIVSYSWDIPQGGKPVLTFTSDEIGREVRAVAGGNETVFTIKSQGTTELGTAGLSEGKRYWCITRKADFDAPTHIDFSTDRSPDWRLIKPWAETNDESIETELAPMQTVFFMETVRSDVDREAIMDIRTGNGAELYVNGESVMKHLNDYRCTARNEKVRVQLHEGDNVIVLRSYNRFEKKLNFMLKVSPEQVLHSMTIPSINTTDGPVTLELSDNKAVSPHQDCQLHNCRVF